VNFHGRSRYEVPWQTVTAIAQCRDRLEESRTMRLASLDLWPTPPHLANSYEVPNWPTGPINCVTRFRLGLSHGYAHLDQINDVAPQAPGPDLLTSSHLLRVQTTQVFTPSLTLDAYTEQAGVVTVTA
jgi:hypothetical protein